MSDVARPDDERTLEQLQEHIASLLRRSPQSVSVAESLTGGHVCAQLSAIDGASGWFRGGVVAYAEQVKFDLLDVEPGPVINRHSARQMATGVARLLGADLAVATTGVGGPGPQEDLPQGTVFIAVATAAAAQVREYRFGGEPTEVVEQATRQALRDLAAALDNAHG